MGSIEWEVEVDRYISGLEDVTIRPIFIYSEWFAMDKYGNIRNDLTPYLCHYPLPKWRGGDEVLFLDIHEMTRNLFVGKIFFIISSVVVIPHIPHNPEIIYALKREEKTIYIHEQAILRVVHGI